MNDTFAAYICNDCLNSNQEPGRLSIPLKRMRYTLN